MAQHYVYRFYAELRDYEPKIWRRFEINGEVTMAELAYAIMLMFEMQASHLFCLRDNRKEAMMALFRRIYTEKELKTKAIRETLEEELHNHRYELSDDEDDYIDDDERRVQADEVKLRNGFFLPGSKLSFEYDFGDGWEVALTLEQHEKQEISLKLLPRVLEGEGYGIIEDVGGVPGLEQFAEAMKKGEGEEYEEYCEWLGIEGFDMEAFDIEDMNFRLKKLIRVYRDIYEYHIGPTEQSIKLLDREYKGKGPSGY